MRVSTFATAFSLAVATTTIADVSATTPCTADSWAALNEAAVAAGVSGYRCWYLPYVTQWTSTPCEANAACISFFSTIVDKIPDCWYGNVLAQTAIENAIEVCTGATNSTSSSSEQAESTTSAATTSNNSTGSDDSNATSADAGDSTGSDTPTPTSAGDTADSNTSGSSSLLSAASASAANGDSNSAGSMTAASISAIALVLASQLAFAL